MKGNTINIRISDLDVYSVFGPRESSGAYLKQGALSKVSACIIFVIFNGDTFFLMNNEAVDKKV